MPRERFKTIVLIESFPIKHIYVTSECLKYGCRLPAVIASCWKNRATGSLNLNLGPSRGYVQAVTARRQRQSLLLISIWRTHVSFRLDRVERANPGGDEWLGQAAGASQLKRSHTFILKPVIWHISQRRSDPGVGPCQFWFASSTDNHLLHLSPYHHTSSNYPSSFFQFLHSEQQQINEEQSSQQQSFLHEQRPAVWAKQRPGRAKQRRVEQHQPDEQLLCEPLQWELLKRKLDEEEKLANGFSPECESERGEASVRLSEWTSTLLYPFN